MTLQEGAAQDLLAMLQQSQPRGQTSDGAAGVSLEHAAATALAAGSFDPQVTLARLFHVVLWQTFVG